MRYLYISIFLFCCISCKVATVKDYTETDIEGDELFQNPYFSSSVVDYVYKADIKVYGNEFSGILILKKVAPLKHRIVFTSQFGTTFFDLEIENDSYRINSIVEQLDRKIILNTLIRDFSLLIKEKGAVTGKYYNDEFTVLQSDSNKRSNYYFYELANKRLHKIVQATKRKEKVIIRFKEFSNNQVAENIRIDHKNIKLNIELNFLKK
ncbi:hypothetical protein [Aquimarina litoralis]|uniref:hypothetical protein n=1 Tax=Aquimarina litoralis TaxID=584605 RepID=UPI001C5888CD|nr:hypothetical protein [Aquimarina litoralis]MBW1297175.1 hypothetical protein [Aquimarina litoralis]